MQLILVGVVSSRCSVCGLHHLLSGLDGTRNQAGGSRSCWTTPSPVNATVVVCLPVALRLPGVIQRGIPTPLLENIPTCMEKPVGQLHPG